MTLDLPKIATSLVLAVATALGGFLWDSRAEQARLQERVESQREAREVERAFILRELDAIEKGVRDGCK